MKPPRFTPQEWETATLALYIRSKGRCAWCGKDLHNEGARHHRQRRREGGDRYANLILLHSDCHNVQPGSVHQEPALASRLGFIVPTWKDPLKAPILIGNEWYLLDDDGTATWCLPPPDNP